MAWNTGSSSPSLKHFFLEITFREKEGWKGIKAEFKKNCKT
jgi:hypothetical protein